MIDWNLVIENLLKIGAGLGLFTGFWLANLCFSLHHNINNLNQSFHWRRILDGIKKLSAVIFGLGFLTATIAIAPSILKFMGVNIDSLFKEEGLVEKIVTNTMVSVIVLKGAYEYGWQAIITVRDIFKKK